eukprot:CAMPEP_0197634188 /NCGR_PEP_ID=MMETSP1338-20131121/10359_1 /TAXON_ID=43686 ORGANISM="Pelagodinium beii, Strain RCC1491" /NCGR_SAMPLE_ID=MMETSP1338 /ASSEMBLY_ACC=CAM_ASM_000754 /LENGTH=62 /DNA_ID=CAMNT_0043206007 /DNA_START=120 /DNA_END=308 /DNA_ORIENTATION=-
MPPKGSKKEASAALPGFTVEHWKADNLTHDPGKVQKKGKAKNQTDEEIAEEAKKNKAGSKKK